MGVTYGLDLFEPTRFKQVTDLFSTDVPAIVSEAKRSVKDEYVLESLSDLNNEEDDSQADILNGLFLEMARARSWDLDKCLGVGLETVFRSVPVLHPLKRKFIDFAEGDIDLPEKVQGAESGLYVVWSSQAIQDCLPAANQLNGPSDVESIVTSSSFSTVQKIMGHPGRARKALERVVQDDYLWRHWQSFREAILQAAKGKYLGFSMYP